MTRLDSTWTDTAAADARYEAAVADRRWHDAAEIAASWSDHDDTWPGRETICRAVHIAESGDAEEWYLHDLIGTDHDGGWMDEFVFAVARDDMATARAEIAGFARMDEARAEIIDILDEEEVA